MNPGGITLECQRLSVSKVRRWPIGQKVWHALKYLCQDPISRAGEGPNHFGWGLLPTLCTWKGPPPSTDTVDATLRVLRLIAGKSFPDCIRR